MALLSLLSTDPETTLTLAGLGLFGPAAFALVATLRSAVEGLFPAYGVEEEPRQWTDLPATLTDVCASATTSLQ